MKDFCIWYQRFFLVVLCILGFFSILPLCFGYRGYAIETGSMEPTIPAGSLVYIKQSDLELDDVITYQTNETIITHRIVGIDNVNRTLITKGDANVYNDDYKVAFDDVLGKVTFSIPFLGWFVLYLQSFEGKFVGIVLLLLMIGCSLYKEKKQ